ncbi:MAG TPA: hypothetical protein VFI54_06285 [Solirubrobacteraceae bacterium]|nr:hypothetical protein [Solirubrobacteraceae bacterium]
MSDETDTTAEAPHEGAARVNGIFQAPEAPPVAPAPEPAPELARALVELEEMNMRLQSLQAGLAVLVASVLVLLIEIERVRRQTRP